MISSGHSKILCCIVKFKGFSATSLTVMRSVLASALGDLGSASMNTHRSAVKRKQLSQEVAKHFNQPGHGLHHIRAVVLVKVRNKDPFVLKATEHMYIGPTKFVAFNRGIIKSINCYLINR